jgi:hypothetical protein
MSAVETSDCEINTAGKKKGITMKTFDDYKGILPYSSELFGIYQPLLGWKSRIILERYERVRSSLYNELAARSLVSARAPVQIQLRDAGTNVVARRWRRLRSSTTRKRCR